MKIGDFVRYIDYDNWCKLIEEESSSNSFIANHRDCYIKKWDWWPKEIVEISKKEPKMYRIVYWGSNPGVGEWLPEKWICKMDRILMVDK